MRMPINSNGGVKMRGILRLRKAIQKANRLASLRMTDFQVGDAIRKVVVLVLISIFVSAGASATTYYVSSSGGTIRTAGPLWLRRGRQLRM